MVYLIISEVCIFILAVIGVIMKIKNEKLNEELKIEYEINKNLQERHTKTINDLAKIRLEKEALENKISELEKKQTLKKATTTKKTTTAEKTKTVKATRTKKV